MEQGDIEQDGWKTTTVVFWVGIIILSRLIGKTPWYHVLKTLWTLPAVY